MEQAQQSSLSPQSWLRTVFIALIAVAIAVGTSRHMSAAEDPFAPHCAQSAIVESSAAVVLPLLFTPTLPEPLLFSALLQRILQQHGMRLVTHQRAEMRSATEFLLHSVFAATERVCVNRTSLAHAIQSQMLPFLTQQRGPFPSPPKDGYALDRYLRDMAANPKQPEAYDFTTGKPIVPQAPPQPSTAYDDAYPLLTFQHDREWLLQDQRINPRTGVAESVVIAKHARCTRSSSQIEILRLQQDQSASDRLSWLAQPAAACPAMSVRSAWSLTLH